MSEALLLSTFSQQDKEYLQTTLECEGKEVFDIDDKMVYLPFAFARYTMDIDKRPLIPTETNLFVGKLRLNQTLVYEYVFNKLYKDGHAMISARPGFGKTITSLYIATQLKVKTLIVVNKLVLIDQWVSAIASFIPWAKYNVIKPKDKILNDASFHIVNATNLVKKSVEFWSTIKFLIVDEVHQIITPKLIYGLLRITPNAILGLSATPYRQDDYDKAINWFFGKNVIGKELNQKHVYKIVRTGFTPRRIEYTERGLNWNLILDDQAMDFNRNKCIVRECIKEFRNNRTILVLVKRVSHAETLVTMIRECNQDVKVSTLLRSERIFDKNCNILIGTTSKIGIGFDHALINCLVIAADIKNYFVQYLGRCMRNPSVIPLVIDFRDDYPVLNSHLQTRISVYENHGGREIEI